MFETQTYTTFNKLDHTPISISAQKLLQKLLKENPRLKEILLTHYTLADVRNAIREWALEYMESHPAAWSFYKNETKGRSAMEKLSWQDYGAIRIMDYLDHAGIQIEDLNLRGKKAVSEPFKMLWLAACEGLGGAQTNFFRDMIHLFRQFSGKFQRQAPDKEQVLTWMKRHHAGLDSEIIEIRKKNKARIIEALARKIDAGELKSPKYTFPRGISWEEKIETMYRWWEEHVFHLRFAVRSPELLNELMGNSLDTETMEVLQRAKSRGIPFFINPYYLSLLNVDVPEFARGADLAIRYYILYSKQLVEEFGHIVAWEKEDIVEPGKPNAAGWILPTRHNVHRRYPEVAILIPDTMGRACAGLCASCQRMYDFQRGHLNFDLEKLKPKESWDLKLQQIMKYWEEDSRLRDVLITGGDALMNSDSSLEKILNAVYEMALRKKEANLLRKDGGKYAEILRVRLGTRLPVYLPQRITTKLADILSSFKEKASAIGIKEFVVQTHFQSPMEITPESRQGIERLRNAGWMVANQLVFTAPSSRRGHTARLRKELNDIGVLPYYTFSVKGYMENSSKFATNARASQEQMEEKVIGIIPQQYLSEVKDFPLTAEQMTEHINKLREKADIPFLATDRNVLNLPGVGKSMSYRVIGITRNGRRILEFDHDHTRSHSPIIEKLGKFVIAESKPIYTYLQQLEEMGEDRKEYESIWGYSIGETEPRPAIYEYPAFDFKLTDEITNFGGELGV
ncbi:MAG: KamA family protein [Bacteroidetes bacterium]|nr:MAG: KamA family protein [Bacteroidota bacterium]